MKSLDTSPLRGIRGGLDNAVRQAEARGLYDMLVIDADCHQTEVYSEFAKYVRPSFRSTLVKRDRKAPSRQYKKVISKRVMRPESSYPLPMRPEEIVETFGRRLQEIGITRAVVIPESMLGLALDRRNPDFEVEVGRAYVQYMVENFGHMHEKFVTVLYAATTAPDKAAEIIDDFGHEKIIAGVLIPARTPDNPSSDKWNPIYDAAQRNGLPICVHGDNPGVGLDTFLENHILSFPETLVRVLVSMVLGGVPVRFPRLKFIFMEGGVTYIPWLMQRMDDEYVKRRFEAPLLTKFPSAYMNEFYYTTQPLESANKFALKGFLNMFDYENHLVYASDYPHWDFDAPSSIYDLPFISDAGKRKILGENAARAFRLS